MKPILPAKTVELIKDKEKAGKAEPKQIDTNNKDCFWCKHRSCINQLPFLEVDGMYGYSADKGAEEIQFFCEALNKPFIINGEYT